MKVYFCSVLFAPRDVLGEIFDLMESVSDGFPPTLLLKGTD